MYKFFDSIERRDKPMTTVFGAINVKWNMMGASNGPLQYPVANEQLTFDGVGRWQQFQGGIISWHPDTCLGAFVVWGLIGELWLRLGREQFGYPITDEQPTGDYLHRGRYNHFRALHLPKHPESSIFCSDGTGTHAIYGAIRDRWAALGWERSKLGFPKSEEYPVRVGNTKYRRSDFEGGYIIWSSSRGAREYLTIFDNGTAFNPVDD